MSRVAYVNGHYLPMHQAMVHVEDRGYQFGDAVYEVCEVREGRLIDERRHLARLERSLDELQIRAPMSPTAIGIVLREVIARNRIRYGIVYLQVGRGVARRAQGFQMRVLYNDAVRAPVEVEKELRAEFVDQDLLFRESDFISLHVPLLPGTRHLISRENIRKMKPTAFLINTARGPVVDEAALAEALEKKIIAGAALDVYEHEPKVHPALVARKDVILSPHIASASVDTRTKMAVMAVENVVAFFEGRRPPNALNADALGLK